MPTVTASGPADGDVVQLVEDKSVLTFGYTCLHCAAEAGVKEAVRALAEAADGSFDAKNIYQETALHLGAWKGHAEGVEDLVGVAADLHAVDYRGRTPLHYAAMHGHEAAMRALECSGADVNRGYPLYDAAANDISGAACQLLESEAAIIILKGVYNQEFRKTLIMAGAEAIGSTKKSKKEKLCASKTCVDSH